ncbi:MAG: DUF2332 domain-containing protein [Ornithinimicrobium sp.]
MDLTAPAADQYREFARYADSSPTYQRWAEQVATDRDVLAWLDALPRAKRQPNLVFAAARWHGVSAPGPYAGLREALLGDDGPITSTVLTRRTQTNEVGRVATLMPVLDRISRECGRPLALVEAGASAGLCLYPDRFDYAWTGDADRSEPHRLRGSAGPELSCVVRGAPRLPTAYPVIKHRSGIDLNPLDVTDEDAMAWLANLVWPGESKRAARLRQAIAVARADPPQIVAGDLIDLLPAQIEWASAYGQVVVFHSAVIAYLDPGRQAEFHALMTELVAAGKCRWISNEDKHVLPRVVATGPDIPRDHPTFVLGLDGVALAWTHGHGSSMTWLR